VVERARTTRRFIKATRPPYEIQSLSILEIDRDKGLDYDEFTSWIKQGFDVGLVSESGMPSVADPGSEIVRYAHQNEITVVPHVGPSSLLLALSASGLNGQCFRFNGYLAIKDNKLKHELRELETRIRNFDETQIFIETPYRNDRLLEHMTNIFSGNIKLCVARDLTGPNEWLLSRPVDWWKRQSGQMKIGKHPCIFLAGK